MNTGLDREQLLRLCRAFGMELHRPGQSQVHFLVQGDRNMLELGRRLKEADYYLVTLAANDERELEDHCFKLYYLFSHPCADLFLVLENALPPGAEVYPSLVDSFPAVDPFERELADLFGVYPAENSTRVARRTYLHPCYPAGLYPLRRDRSVQAIQNAVESYSAGLAFASRSLARRTLEEGEVLLPVGPIHAGVIEPGLFLFRTSGETIEGLEICLGYTHKGIERLFQSCYALQDGWRLAERVSGDTSFAHSLAYCKAVEVLAQARLPDEAHLLRALLLELERIANHTGDCGALAHDVALEMVASELAVLREEILGLNQRLFGSRYLRGLNRPGGVQLPAPLNVTELRETVARVTDQFMNLAQWLGEMPGFRDRAIQIGVLPPAEARVAGVTGLVARASGLARDFRLQHPFGPYAEPQIRTLMEDRNSQGASPIIYQAMTGDVFSRFLLRVQEVHVSAQLVEAFLERWEAGRGECRFVCALDFSQAPNFEFGIGYAEGWRGDIVYWVMKDKFERIYRCKVRDPSTLNWPGLQAAVEPHQADQHWQETSLVDFPLINKSFNLSYSGNDL